MEWKPLVGRRLPLARQPAHNWAIWAEWTGRLKLITILNEGLARGSTGDPVVGADIQQPRVPSPKERRRERLRVWRATNRERLLQYKRKWRTEHPDRVRIHRQREYAARRKKRRRLRLRREAQRRRRALKRAAARLKWGEPR